MLFTFERAEPVQIPGAAKTVDYLLLKSQQEMFVKK